MEHHSNKEAMEAEHKEGESTMQSMHGAMHINVDSSEPRQPEVAPPCEPPTAAAPSSHVAAASPSSPSSAIIATVVDIKPQQAAVAFSSPSPTPTAPTSPSSPIEPNREGTIAEFLQLSSLKAIHRKNKKDKKKKAKEAIFSVDQLSLEENEVSNSTPNNKKNTKIEYIDNKIKLVLGSSYFIQTEKEIDLLLVQLSSVLEKENNNHSTKYKLIQDTRQQKETDLSPKEPKIIGYPCEDPGPFSLGVKINNHFIPSAFIDTGSSVNYMSNDFYDMLDLPKLKSNNQKLVGIIDELPMTIGDFLYPTKFLILNIPRDPFKEIVLGRPFLHSSGAELSMRKGTIKLFAEGNHMRKISMLWNLKSRDDYLSKDTRRGSYLKDLEVIDRFVHIEE